MPWGSEPIGVQVGDFDGDGKQDLVVSNRQDSTIGVLLGNGDGTFKPQVTYATGTNPVAVVIGDFNGDGFQDVSYNINGGTSDTQGVMLGKGDGTFQAELAFATGTHPDGGPMGDSVGDFNGDGLPDISVSNTAQVTVSVLLSQATETAVATATGIAPAGSGNHAVVASYPGDGNFVKSVSSATNLMGAGAAATTPVITWAMPAAITTATALSATQLDATAADGSGNAVPGTFVYSPAAGTMLAAGTRTLSVTFTPTDTTDFTTAMKTVSIVVNQAAAPRFVSNVGTALAAQAVTVGIATGGTVQSIQVLTRGVAGLDFTAASGGSCASGTALYGRSIVHGECHLQSATCGNASGCRAAARRKQANHRNYVPAGIGQWAADHLRERLAECFGWRLKQS